MTRMRTAEQWIFPAARLALFGLLVGLLALGRPALAGAEIPYGNGLLWQIDGAGPEPSYLFGTMHSADEDVTRLAPAVREAFSQAQSLTLEVIMTPEAQMNLAMSMALTDGRTLDQVLGPDLFQRTVTAGRPYGFGQQQLRLFKPWAVMTLLSLPPSEVRRQAAGRKALDQLLQDDAGQRGVPLHSLEEIEEQISLFNDMAEDDQVAMLDATVEQSGQVEGLFEEMRSAYLNQHPARIFELMQAQQTGFNPELVQVFTDRFLDERNDRMVARMQDRLAEGGAFIAVGALHLPGERGILHQLEERGYRLTRLY